MNNKDNNHDSIKLSIVIPCYNEEKNIKRFYDELMNPLKKTGRSFEVVVIDDGSRDNTWVELVKFSKKYTNVRAYRHSRNYGMGAAYQTGFDNSTGKYIITFSSDFEIGADQIEKVAEKLDEGFDVVNTHRKGRWSESKSGSLLRKIPSDLANKIIENISGVSIKDTGSGLKGFRRYVLDNLKIYGDMHRFLPAYASLYTKKITEFPVQYHERIHGKSAYGSITRTFTVFLDLFSMKFMLSFATKPFTMMPGRLFGTMGIISSTVGMFITTYMVILKIFTNQSIGDRPLFIGGLMVLMLGVQFIMTGLLGELMMRIYFESSGRKAYLVSEES